MSNFDKWMSSMRKTIEQKRVQEEGMAISNLQNEQKVEKTPMLQTPSKKASQRIVRDSSEIAQIFSLFDTDHSGTIEPYEFMPLVAKLMRQPLSSLNKDEVWATWDLVDSDGSGTLSYEEFYRWYCEAFGVDSSTDFRSFISDEIVPPEQRRLRAVAGHLGIDFVEIEKIWKEFRDIDADSSGSLDYEEFKVLILQQLSGGPGSPEVPARVVDKFWMEVDTDCSGSITFEEFAAWYLKFFKSDVSPMERYYQVLGTGLRREVSGSFC